jgi:hypothetical protein
MPEVCENCKATLNGTAVFGPRWESLCFDCFVLVLAGREIVMREDESRMVN